MAAVLVIDDDDLMRRLVVAALTDSGYEVTEAASGDEGIAKCIETAPDVVVIDLFMPGKDGIETIRRVRQIQAHIRILAISGGGRYRDPTYLDLSLSLGADAYLMKPFSLSVLRCTVGGLLVDRVSRPLFGS